MEDNNSLTNQIKPIESITDEKELNNIISVFNSSIQKKAIIRSAAYSDLLDKIVNQMNLRADRRIDEFSNKDLLDYLKVIEEASDKINEPKNSIPVPTIQNNTQININSSDALSRESKENVINAIKEILKNSNNVELNNKEIDNNE